METLRVSASEDIPMFSYNNGQKVFETVLNSHVEKTLVVLKEPEQNEKLREKSDYIPAVTASLRTFMREFLLPTMYEEGGIGIASIQVGIPLQAFIVDIPVVKAINGVLCDIPNPRYVRNAVQAGREVRVREHRPVYQDGVVSMRTVEKVLGGGQSDGTRGAQQEEVVEVERHPLFILNPRITAESAERVVIEEGCLSVPFVLVQEDFGGNMKVERPLGITLSYMDLDGRECELWADGALNDHEKLLARCLQHEYDHLHGVLFIDKLYMVSRDSKIHTA